MTDTSDKLNEAKYFLKRLKEANRDKDAFRYNLSAFLSAFCSVPSIMNNEYQKIPGFINWNRIVVNQYFNDKVVSFFKQRRNKSVHIQPVSPRPQQNRMNIPEIDLTKLSVFSLVAKIDNDGIMSNPVLT